MDSEWIARLLIEGLPYAWLVKGIVFVLLGGTLLLQKAQDRLSVWVNILFVATILTGLWVTWLTVYLTRNTTPDEINTPMLWTILITGHIAPWAVNIAGLGVTYYTYRTAPTETKDARDARQDATQEVLDETSLVLARRGKRLSDAGIDLDERILQLGEDWRDADKREHDLDERERT